MDIKTFNTQGHQSIKTKLANYKFLQNWTFRILVIGLILLSLLFIYISQSLPNPNRLIGRDITQSSKIYAKDGTTVLYEIHGEVKRTLVNLDQISPYLVKATIAGEDKGFYNHSGISFSGIFRSLFVDIISLQAKQGGSTITQQFVKNAILTRDKTAIRKIKEIILSLALEARFSKDDILKLYLNEIPYGRNSYGIEAASQTYFSKPAKDLTLIESAYLAALPQAPSFYNPSGPNFENLENRKNYILNQMLEIGYITEEEKTQAENEVVVFNQITTSIKAPHFVQYIQDYLSTKYGEQLLQEGGLKIVTSLDMKMQEIAERVVKEGVEKNKKYNSYNGALVAIDPKTGQILAMVGSKDYFGENFPQNCIAGKNCYFEPQVNVTTSFRQPGSSFKPYAYLTAFEKEFGYGPGSVLMDVVTNFGSDYIPQNFNKNQNGPVSIRKALSGSLNIPAVKILALVGVENVIKNVNKLGIEAPFKDCGLSLVLGGCEIKLIDHVGAYSVFANEGVKNDKIGIIKIEGQNGEILEEYQNNATTVFDKQSVYLLTSILSDNQARSYVFGANSPLTIKNTDIAAKTGTTQDFRDGWTIGYTPNLAAGVWVGNNNNPNNKGLMTSDAVIVAAPIWNAFMTEALKDLPKETFQKPEGIQTITVDAYSGKLPSYNGAKTITDIFADYSIPTETDNWSKTIKIDTQTGEPATDATIAENIKEVTYTTLRSEKPDNSQWESPVIKWALDNGFNYPPNSLNSSFFTNDFIDIVSPKPNTLISKSPFSIEILPKIPLLKVDVSIDDTLITSLNTEPWQTNFTDKLTEGFHKISFKVFTIDGQEKIINQNFQIINNVSPISDNLEFLPIEKIQDQYGLTVKSKTKINIISFYYKNKDEEIFIGNGVEKFINNSYFYSFSWTPPTVAPSYEFIARTDKKITLTKKSE